MRTKTLPPKPSTPPEETMQICNLYVFDKHHPCPPNTHNGGLSPLPRAYCRHFSAQFRRCVLLLFALLKGSGCLKQRCAPRSIIFAHHISVAERAQSGMSLCSLRTPVEVQLIIASSMTGTVYIPLSSGTLEESRAKNVTGTTPQSSTDYHT